MLRFFLLRRLARTVYLFMKREATEYWAQARADFATATLLRDGGCYYASVFFSQQAAEKCLKAISMENFHKVQRGHQLVAIADYLHAPLDVMNCAAELNADFSAALYPEAAGGIPCQHYNGDDAQEHLECARRIMDWSRESLFDKAEMED
jgi:HEPN domain-containing protein